MRIGSKLYLDLLEKAHDILHQARQRGPDSFSSAMWALQADSLFDPAKVAMAHSLRHATQPFLWDQSTEQSDETFQSVAPPTFDELRPYYEALAEQEALAGRVSSEEMCVAGCAVSTCSIALARRSTRRSTPDMAALVKDFNCERKRLGAMRRKVCCDDGSD